MPTATITYSAAVGQRLAKACQRRAGLPSPATDAEVKRQIMEQAAKWIEEDERLTDYESQQARLPAPPVFT